MLATLLSPIAVPFNLSNTLGDGMVLQRAPQSAVVWGFGTPGAKISLHFSGESLSAVVDGNSTWRMTLPPTPATKTGTTLTFSDGTDHLALKDVLFGDVFLCSGQVRLRVRLRVRFGVTLSLSPSLTLRFTLIVALTASCARARATCSTRHARWRA